jgi:hypothetical protein
VNFVPFVVELSDLFFGCGSAVLGLLWLLLVHIKPSRSKINLQRDGALV